MKSMMLNRRRMLLGGSAAAAALACAMSRAEAASPVDDEVIAWLKANAWPLATSEPGSGYADLAPLRAVIGDAHVVALGEATHGTREFFQLKHRIMEFCVSELGFTVIGFEAQHGATLSVNDYVLGGPGNAADAVTGMGFWTWDTEEVGALVEWVRRWNAAHERKVKFYGFDMQTASPAALHLLGYLARVAPDLASAAEEAFAPLTSELIEMEFVSLPARTQEAVVAQLKTVLAAFESNRAAWTGKTSALDWQLARRSAVVIDQFIQIARLDQAGDFPASFRFRDRCMADNVHAMLEAEGPGTRALLWAHNGHVQRTAYIDDSLRNMGSMLNAELARDMVVFGFAFNQGGFTAVEVGVSEPGLQDITIGPAPANFLDAVLASTGYPMFALDLRQVPKDGPVARWMAGKPPQRTIGAVFAPASEAEYAQPADPRDLYEVILFVERTTAARRDWSRRTRFLGNGPNGQPTNLALAGAWGAFPEGWQLTRLSVHPYAASIADERAPAGGAVLRMAREPGQLPFGEGLLTQTFPAAPWRGRRLVFKAAMHAQAARPGTGARLVVGAYRTATDADPSSYKALSAQIIAASRSADWTGRSVTLDVPPNADWILIGLDVTGETTASFGDLALDAMEIPAGAVGDLAAAVSSSNRRSAIGERPVPLALQGSVMQRAWR